MKAPIYLVFGLLVIGLAGYAEWRGLSLNRGAQQRVSPRTVRDNPGAYRSHYFYSRSGYLRGK